MLPVYVLQASVNKLTDMPPASKRKLSRGLLKARKPSGRKLAEEWREWWASLPPAEHINDDTTAHSSRQLQQAETDSETFDWNWLLPEIKDQGLCGSCWAFAAVAAVEAQYKQQYQEGISLSEKHVLDCCSKELCGSCDGGYPDKALDFAIRSGMVESSQIPYGAYDSKCPASLPTAAVRVAQDGYISYAKATRLPANDEGALLRVRTEHRNHAECVSNASMPMVCTLFPQ